MTEQEVQDWVARLTQIWALYHPESVHWRLYEDEITCLQFRVLTESDTEATVVVGEYSSTAQLIRDKEQSVTGSLSCHAKSPFIETTNRIAIYRNRQAEYAQFAAQWLPFFRRCCWLSGFPSEASAHEKTEWMQGFSCEELQAWNLKL